MFVLGAFYLISGIYSVGIALLLQKMAMPISGYIAYAIVPDSFFPFEIVFFIMSGVTFLIAALVEFRKTVRTIAQSWDAL